VVHSAIKNFERRQLLREHAGRLKVKVVFALGQLEDGIPDLVRREAASFSDLIVGSFVDAYANLTLKHLFALNWIATNCPAVDFIVKTDDDIVINFKQIFHFFDRKYPPVTNKIISRVGSQIFAGYLLSSMPVTRDSRNKWCTRTDEYQMSTYPEYCSGWAYVTTTETIVSILAEVKTISRGLWIDDVFVTGILRESSGTFIEPLNPHFSLDVVALRKWTDSNSSCAWDKMFSNTDNDTDLLKSAYSRLESVDPEWKFCPGEKDNKIRATGRPHVSIVHLSAAND
jgi:hypothetical protein